MAGIVGIYSRNPNLTQDMCDCLSHTNTRGQESAGVSVLGNHALRTYDEEGTVLEVFNEKFLNAYAHPTDYVSIGHVEDKKVHRAEIAPAILRNEKYEVSVSLDGLLLNKEQIKNEYKLKVYSDEQIIGKLFLRRMEEYKDLMDSASAIIREIDNGYFSAVIGLRNKQTQESKLIGFRDKRGVKPMYMGRTENELYLSSESGAIEITEKEFLEKRDVIPGEVVVLDDVFRNAQALKPERKHDIFEWVYNARFDAVMEGRTAHVVRERLGTLLAELHGIEDDGNSIIIGVPDSGRSVALGLHQATGIPFDEAIGKNQYSGRTYLIYEQSKRDRAARVKHYIVKEIIKGKRVIIGDDSIVRGTISENLSKRLLNAGAKSVEFIISYAPIFYPCFSDEPNKKLAAKGMGSLDIFQIGEQVAKKLPSIDKVYFNTPENVIKAVIESGDGSIDLSENDFCTRCIGGPNPFD